MNIKYHPNTAGYCILFLTSEYADRVAVSCYDDYRCTRYTYRELFGLTIQTATYLHNKGCKKNDALMVCAENSAEYTLLIFAAALLGLKVVPVDFNTSDESFVRLYNAVKPRFLFTSREALLEGIRGDHVFDIDYLIEDIADLSPDLKDFFALSPDKNVYIDENDVYLEIFTSGTTSEPKVVPLTHRNLISNLTNFRRLVFVPENYRMLSMAPLSHALGLTMGLYCMASYGANVVYVKKLTSTNIMRVMHNDKIDAVLTVPAFLNILKDKIEEGMSAAGKLEKVQELLPKMLKLPMFIRRLVFRSLIKKLGGDLKWIATGASSLNVDVGNFWESVGIKVTQGYGLTECMVVSISDFSWRRMGTVGRSLPNQHVRVDENNELWVAGAHVFEGYIDREEVNAEIFEDGWFRTGDLCTIDDDGHITIVGRAKNVIISPSGLNIYPEDIEAVVDKQPEVQECVVVNMPRREDELYLVAFVLLSSQCNEELEAETLRERINDSLSSHQKLAKIYVWHDDDFPRTASRKVKRSDVEKAISNVDLDKGVVDCPETTTSELDGPLEEQILGAIAASRKIDLSDVRPTDRLISDLGFDSIGLVELLATLQETLGAEVPQEEVFNNDVTVEELVELIGSGACGEGVSSRTIEVSPLLRALFSFNRSISRALLPMIFRSIFSMKIENKSLLRRELVPAMKRQGHLIIANHNSHLDTMSIYSAFPHSIRRRIVAGAAHDYFFSPEARGPHYLLQSYIRSFPIKRTANPCEYFTKIGELLDRGDSVLIFPEGTRSRSGQLNGFMPSVGQMIKEVKAPVVPLFLYGTHDLWPPDQERPKRGPIRLAFNGGLNFSRRLGPYDIRDQLFELYTSEFE